MNDINIDMGIAKPTNKALRNPKKNISTVTTNRMPKMMLLTRSSTWFNVLSEESLAIVIVRSVGK